MKLKCEIKCFSRLIVARGLAFKNQRVPLVAFCVQIRFSFLSIQVLRVLFQVVLYRINPLRSGILGPGFSPGHTPDIRHKG